MMKIGFDLDGVLVDQTHFKKNKFEEMFGIKLEPWQVSSNVIDNYVPDSNIRRTVGRLSGTYVHNNPVDILANQYLQKLNQQHELYLISTRGKTNEGITCGHKIMKKLKLDELFGQNIYFCVSDDDKIKTVQKLNCDVYLDDRKEVVDNLASLIELPILFDPSRLVETGHVKSQTKVANSFSDFYSIIGAQNDRYI